MYQFRTLADPDFMSKEAPPNYIAGLGRGATGFTTRSDIGPAREIDDGTALAAAQAAAEGRGPKRDDDDDGRFQDPDKEVGLFNKAPYEQDDEEADRIYEQIEKKMDERRKLRREARERDDLEQYRKEKPKIQQQFQDLKRGLSMVSNEEWAAIPEVQDMVRKRGAKKVKTDEVYARYSAVPDSVILSNLNQGQMANSIDVSENGTETSLKTDFAQFGQARDRVLAVKLDQMSDSVSGQTTIDPKGYLTGLGSVITKSDAEISDIKKARTLMRSVITTNPKHPPGWIAAARLEEYASKLAAARDIISKGCEECPTSEDVWLEAARLNTPDAAKIILANAIRHIPQSVNVWIKAKELEVDPKAQKKVLRRALEYIPNSVKLWKSAISLEDDPDDAKVLLSRSVQCVPNSIELWLAFARLETYEKAQKIINQARIANPTSHEIWIAAAKLEEQNGKPERVGVIIKRAVVQLQQKGALLERDQWIKEAEQCEKDGFLQVCRALINETISLDVDEEDRKSTWMDDAEKLIANGSYDTARAVYGFALQVFPNKKSIWRRLAFLEKSHGTRESLLELLEKAVESCPQAEILWLMWAKEKWVAGDITAAKAILENAFAANSNSEQIWLAAIKLEVETGHFENAQTFLAKAREQANTERVWMKSAVLERLLKNFDKALELLDEGLKRFPTFEKLWLIKGQILKDDMANLEAARANYTNALKILPKSHLIWIHSSRLEESAGQSIKARVVLERARILNPKCAELWTEAILVEKRAGNTSMAKALLAKGLQECPKSGSLWCEAILMEIRPQRRARSSDALKNCENDPEVVTTIARLFWSERKFDKARNWFTRAIKTNPDLGDAWAWWLKFEIAHGTSEQQQSVIEKCKAAEPRHGTEWTKESKNLANNGKTTEDILMLVVKKFKNELQ
ncbi:PRP1 splicing factor, N-terminal-domain-containing protein [Globomyces pollinis-pini]|nr:PRP1 splicing factor, N-terminal-domain-containing protein [Globomyces pollinis-pini]